MEIHDLKCLKSLYEAMSITTAFEVMFLLLPKSLGQRVH